MSETALPTLKTAAMAALLRDVKEQLNAQGWNIRFPDIMRPLAQAERIGNELRLTFWVPLDPSAQEAE